MRTTSTTAGFPRVKPYWFYSCKFFFFFYTYVGKEFVFNNMINESSATSIDPKSTPAGTGVLH